MNDVLVQMTRSKLQNARRILVVSHIRPDGDAIGSLLGFGLALQESGRQVQMVLADGVPASFRHLPGSESVRQKADGFFDMVCVLDCSDLKRTGLVLEDYGRPDLNIDHHITNVNFAEINLVDTQAVATAEILVRLLRDLDLPFPQPAAAGLLTGIITDTLGFRTSNMTPEAMRIAADLMEAGASLPELYQRALIDRSFEAVRFWGYGLTKLQRDGSMVWTTLTMEDRKAAGYSGRDDADLINILSSIESAEVAMIFVEQPNDHVKVSWRAQPGFDVSPIALSFGGGGHPAASGADIPGEMEEVQANVLRATRALLERVEI